MVGNLRAGVALFIMVASCTCFGQSGRNLTSRLDSLLLGGQFSTFISAWQEVPNATRLRELSPAEYSNYHSLSQTIHEIPGAAEGRLRQLCENFGQKSVASGFRRVGKNAEIEYADFLEKVQDGDCVVTLDFYYAAVHFRREYVGSQKMRLLDNYRKARKLVSSGRYDDALKLI